MTDLTKLRDELRGLRRSDLLIIAERAVELVSNAKLRVWDISRGNQILARAMVVQRKTNGQCSLN
jgi:hypothetical protein